MHVEAFVENVGDIRFYVLSGNVCIRQVLPIGSNLLAQLANAHTRNREVVCADAKSVHGYEGIYESGYQRIDWPKVQSVDLNLHGYKIPIGLGEKDSIEFDLIMPESSQVVAISTILKLGVEDVSWTWEKTTYFDLNQSKPLA